MSSDPKIEMEIVTDTLFQIIQNKELDVETRTWAREEMSQILRVLFTTMIYVPEGSGVIKEYKP